jgi:fatty acid desaturase
VLAYALVYGAVVGAVALAERIGHPVVYALTILFIGARQHSLYILSHDAAHNSIFTSRETNKAIATWLSNLPFLHHPEAWSYIQWRRIHLLHHSGLFSAADPNYVGRRTKGDTLAELTRPALAWRCLRTGLLSSAQWVIGRQDYVAPRGNEISNIAHSRALFTSSRGDPEMRSERRLTWAFLVAFIAIVTALGGWRIVALYWLVPMYTVYPAILHLMDLTEHRWSRASQDLVENTRSSRPGVVARLFLTELPRTYHREHHVLARVPVHHLPALHRVLVANRIAPPAARNLWDGLRELPWRRAASRGKLAEATQPGESGRW